MSVSGGWIVRPISRMASVLNWAAIVAISMAVLLTTADALLRYMLNTGIPGVYHLSEYLLVAIIALPLAKCQEDRAHIRVDLLVSKIRGRPYLVMEILTLSLAVTLFAFATYTTGSDAVRSYISGDYEMGIINYPKWPSKAFIPLGTGLFCMRLLIDIVLSARAFFSGQAAAAGMGGQ